jgi:hypothetical protein
MAPTGEEGKPGVVRGQGQGTGMGEMQAIQLKEGTLDPASPTLLRVDIDSAIKVDKTFAQLLDKDASGRYRVIMSEASEIDGMRVALVEGPAAASFPRRRESSDRCGRGVPLSPAFAADARSEILNLLAHLFGREDIAQ